MIFVFLCLTYFTQYDNLQVHPCCCKWHYFILFYDSVIFLIYMYHNFFIHSSVSGHLGCFHVLAIVNSVAMNIGVHVSFQIMVFSGYMPRNGIAGSYGSAIFSFLRNLLLFSIVAVLIYIPTNSARGFPFLHTLSSIYCLQIFFDDGHSDQCKVIPHYSFDLHFSNNQ